MAKTKPTRFDERNKKHIYFTEGRGIRLFKRFCHGRPDEIVFKTIERGSQLLTLPTTRIDALIEALLQLKVLMEDGGDYNSGSMRLALVDGSGMECGVDELNGNGRQNARFMAQNLIEEINERDDEAGREAE